MDLSWIGWAHLVLLVAVLPALALMQAAVPEPLPPRRAIYLSASAVLWSLAVITVAVLLWEGIGPHHLRIYGTSILATLAWAVGTTVLLLLVGVAVTLAGRVLGVRESVWVVHLMPRDRTDRFAFTGVALTAGITEELMYRGYALWALAGALGDRPWLAAVILGLPFGFLHGYQNAIGMVRAGLLGVILAAPVLAGGGLIAAVLAHAGVDLIMGFGWKRFLPEPVVEELSTPPEVT